ncbi:MAG: hypothetical protein JNK47_11090 [Mesorhizobium sp.]|nr:hypothetical protein [Mesorhizobium sp.]MBL8577764.1 hypothetical protein [Mesorhizobium sp.]
MTPRRGILIPDIGALPADALLTRQQMVALSGYSEAAFKKWGRQRRGPAFVVVEGRPRYRAADARAWLSGGAT